MSFYIRVWQLCQIEEITKHLVVVGGVTADCAHCRELGIDYAKTPSCPKCGTLFRFITARNAGKLNPGRGAVVKRIKERCPNMTFIDYDDYREVTGKQQAREFFT